MIGSSRVSLPCFLFIYAMISKFLEIIDILCNKEFLKGSGLDRSVQHSNIKFFKTFHSLLGIWVSCIVLHAYCQFTRAKVWCNMLLDKLFVNLCIYFAMQPNNTTDLTRGNNFPIHYTPTIKHDYLIDVLGRQYFTCSVLYVNVAITSEEI